MAAASFPPNPKARAKARQTPPKRILKVVVTKSGAIPSSLSEIVAAKIIIAHRLIPANMSGLGKLALYALFLRQSLPRTYQ